MSRAFEHLQGHQFINLTTYRKNGQPVVTTVWFAHDGDRLVGTTLQHAGKIKRLRHTPSVNVAPSTFDGKTLGEAVAGLGRLLPPEEAEAAQTALRAKYGERYDQVTARTDSNNVRVFWEIRPQHPA